MGGFGMALAGALSGLGTGIAEQGKINLAQRHQMALEDLRSQNQRAELSTQADLNDRNSARMQARDYTFDVGRKRVEAEAQMERDAANNAFRSGEKQNDRSHEEKMARLNMTLDVYKSTYGTTYGKLLEDQISSGEIQDVRQDDRGNFFGVRRNGSIADLGVTGAVPGTSSSGIPGLNYGTPQTAAGGKPAEAPANPGLNRRTQPTTPAKNLGSRNQPVAWITDEAKIDEFLDNPANKGKWFVGPDGQTHQVR